MSRSFLASTLIFVLTLPAAAGGATNDDAVSRPAPDFSLPGRDGTISLDSLRGHLVYVDFWASWCGPCRISFPWLRSLHERYSAKGLVIVAIDLDKSRDAADEFLKHFNAPFLVAFDPAGTTAEAYNVTAMPSSYLISPTGAILHSQPGFDPKKSERTEALIREALSR